MKGRSTPKQLVASGSAAATVSMRVIRRLVELVEQAGVSRNMFVRAAGLRAEQIDSLDARVSRREAYRIHELALDLTGDPALGLASLGLEAWRGQLQGAAVGQRRLAGSPGAIQQLAVRDGVVADGGEGWYYDDFMPELDAMCAEGLSRRIAFSAGARPPRGVSVQLECDAGAREPQ